jgi:hypothetical protein
MSLAGRDIPFFAGFSFLVSPVSFFLVFLFFENTQVLETPTVVLKPEHTVRHVLSSPNCYYLIEFIKIQGGIEA